MSTSAEIVAKEREVHWSNRNPVVRKVAGVIIYISSKDSILTYLRDDNPRISHPNTVNFFGGMTEDGEDAEQTVRREVSEELVDRHTDIPYEVGELRPFTALCDQRGVQFDLFWTEVNDIPDLRLNGEGQEIIEATRDQVLNGQVLASNGQPVEFSLDYLELARNFFQSH